VRLGLRDHEADAWLEQESSYDKWIFRPCHDNPTVLSNKSFPSSCTVSLVSILFINNLGEQIPAQQFFEFRDLRTDDCRFRKPLRYSRWILQS